MLALEPTYPYIILLAAGPPVIAIVIMAFVGIVGKQAFLEAAYPALGILGAKILATQTNFLQMFHHNRMDKENAFIPWQPPRIVGY